MRSTTLYHLHRDFYHSLKPTTAAPEASPIKKYYQEYEQDFQKTLTPISFQSFREKLMPFPLIIWGDYHSLPTAQSSLLEFLNWLEPQLKSSFKTLCLALEAFPQATNVYLRRYLKGQLSLDELFKKTKFDLRWGFPREPYIELLEFAKARQIEIYGINTFPKSKEKSLEMRDQWAADFLCKLLKNPKRHVVTLIGDLHLTQKYLPTKLEDSFKSNGLKRKPYALVHLNQDSVFWKAHNQGFLFEHKTYEIKPGTYCLLNSTPWVKLFSYLAWLEKKNSQTKEFWQTTDGQAYLADGLYQMARIAGQFFQLPDLELSNFHLKDPADLPKTSFSKIIYDKEGVLWDPTRQSFYLESANFEKMAYGVGQYLFSLYSKNSTVFSSPRKHWSAEYAKQFCGFLVTLLFQPYTSLRHFLHLDSFLEVKKLARDLWDEIEKIESDSHSSKRLLSLLPVQVTPSKTWIYYQAIQILGFKEAKKLLKEHYLGTRPLESLTTLFLR